MGRPQQTYREEQSKEVTRAYTAKRYKRANKVVMLTFANRTSLHKQADCSEGLVKKAIGAYNREGLAGVLRGRFGGNRRNLSQEAEEALLAPFLAMAERGRILIASDIHKAYGTMVGRTVPPSTVYSHSTPKWAYVSEGFSRRTAGRKRSRQLR